MSKTIMTDGKRIPRTMTNTDKGHALATALAKKYGCSIGHAYEAGAYALDLVAQQYNIMITNKAIIINKKED